LGVERKSNRKEVISMAESIIGGIAVVAFVVFLSASNAIFEMRKLERERKARELELIKQQEEWLLVQKGMAMERTTLVKMAQATLAKGPCKEIV
jgi:hypothetical protein